MNRPQGNLSAPIRSTSASFVPSHLSRPFQQSESAANQAASSLRKLNLSTNQDSVAFSESSFGNNSGKFEDSSSFGGMMPAGGNGSANASRIPSSRSSPLHPGPGSSALDMAGQADVSAFNEGGTTYFYNSEELVRANKGSMTVAQRQQLGQRGVSAAAAIQQHQQSMKRMWGGPREVEKVWVLVHFLTEPGSRRKSNKL